MAFAHHDLPSARGRHALQVGDIGGYHLRITKQDCVIRVSDLKQRRNALPPGRVGHSGRESSVMSF
eukprot:8686911-Alexandrium_andersonii.AAC.1